MRCAAAAVLLFEGWVARHAVSHKTHDARAGMPDWGFLTLTLPQSMPKGWLVLSCSFSSTCMHGCFINAHARQAGHDKACCACGRATQRQRMAVVSLLQLRGRERFMGYGCGLEQQDCWLRSGTELATSSSLGAIIPFLTTVHHPRSSPRPSAHDFNSRSRRWVVCVCVAGDGLYTNGRTAGMGGGTQPKPALQALNDTSTSCHAACSPPRLPTSMPLCLQVCACAYTNLYKAFAWGRAARAGRSGSRGPLPSCGDRPTPHLRHAFKPPHPAQHVLMIRTVLPMGTRRGGGEEERGGKEKARSTPMVGRTKESEDGSGWKRAGPHEGDKQFYGRVCVCLCAAVCAPCLCPQGNAGARRWASAPPHGRHTQRRRTAQCPMHSPPHAREQTSVWRQRNTRQRQRARLPAPPPAPDGAATTSIPRTQHACTRVHARMRQWRPPRRLQHAHAAATEPPCHSNHQSHKLVDYPSLEGLRHQSSPHDRPVIVRRARTRRRQPRTLAQGPARPPQPALQLLVAFSQAGRPGRARRACRAARRRPGSCSSSRLEQDGRIHRAAVLRDVEERRSAAGWSSSSASSARAGRQARRQHTRRGSRGERAHWGGWGRGGRGWSKGGRANREAAP